MSKTQFGMSSWDEVETAKKKTKTNNSDKYLRLQQGSNVVRILTNPFKYSVHYYKPAADAPGYGDRIVSCAPNEPDPLEEKGVNPDPRCYLGVIDRRTSSYKILDASKGLIKLIQVYTRDEDWGDPKAYDIDIKVDKQGGATGYYAVIPKSKKPLSASDIEIKGQVDIEYLKKVCTPSTREDMLKKIAAADAKYKQAKGGSVEAAPSSSPKNDDGFDFPAVDE